MTRFALMPCVALALACGSADPKPDRDPSPHGPADAPTPSGPKLVTGGAALRPEVVEATLANGLKVYIVPDHGAPLVSVQVWVQVGSADEHEGKDGPGSGITGLSHFFEHLMFQGTQRFPDYDLALGPLGAKNNAFTMEDATVFWAYSPKEHLATILDIEADRFEHMQVDFLHVEPEREVVKSERRQVVDADPEALAEERAVMRSFDRTSYRWGPIGWMADLDAVPIDVVQRYFAEHYGTSRTVLVITGDVDPSAALGLVKDTWGKVTRVGPRPAVGAALEVQRPIEDWVGPRRDHIVRQVSQPTVLWAFRAPAPNGATARAYAALELVDHALTAGKAGRLSRRLVFTEEPKVTSLSARLSPKRYAYPYIWSADLLPGVSTGEVEAAIDDELAAVRERGLTADELVQAVASLRADTVRAALSPSDKGEAIGMSLLSTGAPFGLWDRLDVYPTITQDEIKAAVATYLVPDKRVRVVVVAPQRIVALAQALADLRAEARPLQPLLASAAMVFIKALELAEARAELEREQRAVNLLETRARNAMDADPAAKAAIEAYLRDNEMGARARRKVLGEQEADLVKHEQGLTAARKKLQDALMKVLQKAPALGEMPEARALAALAAPLGASTPARPAVSASAADIASTVLVAFALEARDMSSSAQKARAEAIVAAAEASQAPPSPEAKALTAMALELARDSEIVGVPLKDKPMKRAPAWRLEVK